MQALMMRMTVDQLLAMARSGLCMLSPVQALQAMRSGAALIDIRVESQIARDGTIAGALIIARNVLEWRLDPDSRHRHPQAPRLGDRVILLCDGRAGPDAADAVPGCWLPGADVQRTGPRSAGRYQRRTTRLTSQGTAPA